MSTAHAIRLGDTFRYTQKREEHLWMVISDPQLDQSVLIANLTTYKPYKDGSCRLNRGEHPFIKHETCVNYAFAQAPDGAHLIDLYVRDKIELLEPLSVQTLAKVQYGALVSPHIPDKYRRFLRSQVFDGSDDA
jgi:hypothetical protein